MARATERETQHSSPEAPLVTARGVSRIYPFPGENVVALRDVDLTVERGGFVAIVGRSGSGKSTLLELLGGLARPTSGEVRFDGLDLASLDPSRLARLRLTRIGLLLQDSALVHGLSALDNVRLPLFLAGRLEESGRALELLDELGLPHRTRHLPGQLSRGEAQRVALARALVHDPSLLLADEPTGSLDRPSTEAVKRVLARFASRDGKAVLLATHDLELAAMASTVVELSYGRLRPAETKGALPAADNAGSDGAS